MVGLGLETQACAEFAVAQNFMQSHFQAHMNENGLSYATSEEYNLRMSIFAEKDAFINEHNDAEVDWRAKGAVNPVKDQARCGSCWAFSAVCSFEGAHAIKTGNLVSMSEQQVVSCDTVSFGCNGGWQYAAFEYFEATADELESDYPYTSGSGATGSCKPDAAKETYFVDTYANVPSNSVR